MSSQYGELRPTSGWELLASLGHPSKFQRVSRLGSVNERHSSSGRQPNFAALNRGCHLYSARRPSRWTLAHILGEYNSYEDLEPREPTELFTTYGCRSTNTCLRFDKFQSNQVVLLWPPCVADADIIFLPWFLLSCFFLSSPNVSRRRLDIYHTSTHGVALVRI